MSGLHKVILLIAVLLFVCIAIPATSGEANNSYWNVNKSSVVAQPEKIATIPTYPYSDIYRVIDYQTGKVIYIACTNRGSTHQAMSVVDLSHK